MNRKFKIKGAEDINKSAKKIEDIMDRLISNYQYPIYDPDDHYNRTTDIDDLLTVILFLQDMEVEEASVYYNSNIIPTGNIMIETFLGKLGIHSDIMDVIATQIPPNIPVNTCQHLNKYKNTLSASLSFWVCPDCKKEV